MLGGGRHSLDNIFQWVFKGTAPQVKKLHRYFGIGQELREGVVLFQVFAECVIVGEISVMHQGFVHTAEGVRPAGMPHPSLGGVALVGNPAVGFEILQQVVLDDLLCIADKLQYHDIASVRQHKSPLISQRGIELLVDTEGVLADIFVLNTAGVNTMQPVFLYKTFKYVFFNPDEITPDIGRLDLQSFYLPVIVHRGKTLCLVYIQIGFYEESFHFRAAFIVKQSYL